jgi:hypothetical protein
MSVSFEHVRIAQGVEQLPESEWQNLVYGRPALRLEVLGAIARNATRPLPLQFFLLEDRLLARPYLAIHQTSYRGKRH